MANKDFRAKQIRTSRIIGSGSLIGSDRLKSNGQIGGSPHTTIMSASNAADFIGGIENATTFEAVGRDVGLFISGSTGKRLRWAGWSSGDDLSQGGVTLVGGDLHISGNVTAEGSGLGGYITGTFNEPTTGGAFVTTASVSIAGNEGFTFRAKSGGPTGGVGTGTDVFFFVSGSRTRSGSDDRSDVNGPAVALFGGDLVVSGTLYAERQVIEVDERVDGAFFVSGAMQVSQSATVHNYLDVLGNTSPGTKYGARLNSTYPIGNWRLENSAVNTTALWSETAAGSSHVMGIDLLGIRYLTITGSNSLPTLRKAVFNENSLDIDFRVQTDNLRGAILADGGTDQVIFGADALNAANAYGNSLAVPDDVSVYLSGSTGGRNTSDSTTIVAAGDFVVSGSAFIEHSASIGKETLHNTKMTIWAHPIQSYFKFSTRAGDLVVEASGSNANSVIVRPETDSTTAFQVQSGSGGAPILNVDATNSRVGIRTALPRRDLHVHGTANASVAQFTSEQTGGGSTDGALIGINSSNDFLLLNQETGGAFVFTTDSTEKLRVGSEVVVNENDEDIDFRVESETDTHALFVDAGQSTVGIGTDSPAASVQLHVGNASAAAGSRTIIQLENEYAGNDYDTQVTFAKGGTATYAFGVDDSDSDKLKVATGGLLGAANTSILEMSIAETVFNEDAQDQDFRVESENNEYMLFVDAHTDRIGIGSVGSSPASTVHIKEISPEIRIERQGNTQDSTIAFHGALGNRGSMTGLVGGTNDIKFDTYNGSTTEEILRLGGLYGADGGRQVIILSGSGMDDDAMQPRLSTDIAFFVSGSTDSRYGDDQGIAVFGGDLHVSGNLTVDGTTPGGGGGAADVGWTGPAAGQISTTGSLAIGTDLIHAGDVNTKIAFTDDAIDIRAGGRSFIQITESATDLINFNESENANYEFVIRNSSGRVFGTNDSGVVINEQGMPASDFRVESNQKTHAIFLEADNQYIHFLADTASPAEASDPAIKFYVSGTKGTGDGVRKDDGLTLFGGDLVLSGNLFVDPESQAQKLVFGRDPQGSFIKTVGPIPGASGGQALDLAGTMIRIGYDVSDRLGATAPADSNIFISGSIGSRGSHPTDKDRRGTAVFGGDVVVSGSIRGRQLHYSTHKYTAGGTAQQYLRFDANGSDGSPGANNKMIAPYSGSLIKVMARGTGAGGSTTISLHTNPDGDTNVNTTATGTTQTVNMNAADTSFTFTFANDAIYDPGHIVGLSVNPQFDPGNVVVTAVWEYYTHEP